MEQNNISINGSTELDEYLFYSRELWTYYRKQYQAEPVFIWIISVIEIPVMILTLIALCFLVKSRPAASVFVGHLILSDLVQVMCMLGRTISQSDELYGAYYYSLIVGLYFMACVSFERYLLVSHPIWYKSHQSLKLSCFISVIVWFVPLIFAEIHPYDFYFKHVPLCIACLIPYPIVILCFVGTCRGLSRSISLTALKRKLILGSLFLVLLTYTFIILPFVILSFIKISNMYTFLPKNHLLFVKCYEYVKMFLYVNPLADCMLYLFMRPDVGDLMKSVRCCCRHQSSVLNRPESHALNTAQFKPAAK